MLTPPEVEAARTRALRMLEEAGIALREEEGGRAEVVDFGLSELERTGLQLFTYMNNSRYCAKELVFFPGQTCPEHWHPPVGDDPGKMETLYVRAGLLRAYVEGPAAGEIHASLPRGSEDYYTVRREIELRAGEQYTIAQGVRHWFQAGPEGAVVLEVSSACRDEYDLFTDPRIVR